MKAVKNMTQGLGIAHLYAGELQKQLAADERMLENIGILIADALVDVISVLNQLAPGTSAEQRAKIDHAVDGLTLTAIAMSMSGDLLTDQQRDVLMEDFRVATVVSLMARRLQLPAIPLGSPKMREQVTMTLYGLEAMAEKSDAEKDGAERAATATDEILRRMKTGG